MALKKGGLTSLSGMIDSDDEVDMMPSPGSNQENESVGMVTKSVPAATAKPRGRPPGKTTTAAKPKAAASKRAPLKEQANEQHDSDAEDGDELGGTSRGKQQPRTQEIEPEVAPKKRGRPPGKSKTGPVEKGNVAKPKATVMDGEFEYTPTRTEPNKTSKHTKAKKGGREDSGEEDNDQTMLSIEEDDVQPTKAKRANSSRPNQTQSMAKARSNSRRAGSPSGDERGEPNLRRKLGEMTRKFEALESRYRNLKEIGVVEAEANFDRLKKQSEQRTKAANDLIESLRNELEAQRSLSQETRDQNSSLAASEARVTELTASLNAARKENQALQAKVARNGADSSARGVKVSAARSGVASNSELQNLQLKEDLYSDLTGLIIRSVTKQDNAATFDCIQTGCNGTLHFKLSVTSEESGASYEETEFSYDPRLDRNRDQELIEIMPDYLREEITFSRANAAKFYSRIADTVTKRIVED